MDVVSTQIDQKNSNSIVEYGLMSHALKSRNEIASKSAVAPIQYDKFLKKTEFSTLFCPTGFEFFDIDDDKNIRAGYYINNNWFIGYLGNLKNRRKLWTQSIFNFIYQKSKLQEYSKI